MSRTLGTETTLTIAINTSVSSARVRFADLKANQSGKQLPRSFCIIAPAELTNTIKIRGGNDTAEGFLDSGGSDIQVRAGRVTHVTEIMVEWIELVSVNGSDVETNEAAARSFQVVQINED